MNLTVNYFNGKLRSVEPNQDTKVILRFRFHDLLLIKFNILKLKPNIESSHQTTANEQLFDGEIILMQEDSVVSNESIQINEIQNSIMDSNPISVINNESQVNEIPALMDSTQISIKKVIISIYPFNISL